MRDLAPGLLRGACRVLAFALAIGVGACASGDDPGQRGAKPPGTIGARLVPIGGSVGHGLVVFRPYDGGVVMVADIGGFNTGPHRIVIHTTPVCTSPNGFSAGPPLVLPSTGAAAVVTAWVPHEGTASIVMRIPGLAISGPSGVEGRSVVLHAGQEGSLEAQPGVPNGRVACGVIGPVSTFQF